MAPTWSELAKDLEADPLVSIGKLDCTQAESICRDIGVKGYPTLQYFRDGQKVEHYSGPRYNICAKNEFLQMQNSFKFLEFYKN